MPAYIHNITTKVPKNFYEQQFLRERMKEYISKNRATQRIIHRIYTKSGIEKRHTVIHDFNSNGQSRFFFKKDGSLKTPSTGTRNNLYSLKAKPLFVETAQKTLEASSSFKKEDVTHVITVSCTGFFSPEPAFEIITQLGLPNNTQRFHIGFMGCFAAFPALKMAKSFCEAQPNAVVLVVCLELCSLHLQQSESTDSLISASVFADGAAGVLISGQKPENTHLKLSQFYTSVAQETTQEMTWTIGDTGFDMVLSSYVPQIIETNLPEALQSLFKDYEKCPNEIPYWAVHPGGRAILDKIENSFKLRRDQLSSSRKTLKNYGNMSSATILFVLANILEKRMNRQKQSVLAMAFGPGLTIESGFFTKIDPS